MSAAGQHADARLAAAAPDLLEAALKALPFVEDAEKDPAYKPGYARRIASEIRKTIARATGDTA